MESTGIVNQKLQCIVDSLTTIEDNITVLTGAVLKYRNEIGALQKRIDILEQENLTLKEKKQRTVERLKMLLDKFEQYGL